MSSQNRVFLIAPTVAGHTREGDVHADSQPLPSAFIHNQRRIHVDAPIVEEFDGGECQDDCSSNQGHFTRVSAQLVNQIKARHSSQKAPVRVLTFTSSIV